MNPRDPHSFIPPENIPSPPSASPPSLKEIFKSGHEIGEATEPTMLGIAEHPINIEDYFGQGRVLVSLDGTLRANALTLITRVNRLMRQFGQNRRVVRGFDLIIEGDPYTVQSVDREQFLPSKHQSAEAVDLADPEGDLDQWLLDNQKLLESSGLWIEHPATTRGHCHLQSCPPRGGSRRRVFYP